MHNCNFSKRVIEKKGIANLSFESALFSLSSVYCVHYDNKHISDKLVIKKMSNFRISKFIKNTFRQIV